MSSAKAADATATLVVPIDVVGLCIGEDDYQQATGGFAGATAVYDQQVTSKHAAFLGDNVARGFDDDPWDQLQTGVHLHWALPDGLTSGGGPGHELDFPAAPNRWLVTRIAISGGTVATRSWLVESDALSAQQPPQGSSVTLPVKPGKLGQDFGFLGRSQALGPEGWSAELATDGPALADAAGAPLNAVSNGEIGFAAYYPGCRGVFGFWDELDDIDPPKSAPAQLSYSVIGWYDEPAHDPVQPGATPAQLEKALGWTFAAADPAPSGSIYAGTFDGIGWSRHLPYVLGQPVQQPLQARAAIGNTSAEALAAYFTAREAPTVPLFETLLDAFQSGLLDTFKQPAANGLSQLEERLHDQRFAGLHSGTVFSIVSADDDGPDPRELIDLPAPLADALDTLNVLRRQADQCAFHADWYRWQLFADWYRIFMIDASGQNEAYAIAAKRYGDWQDLANARDTLNTAADRQHDAVTAQLNPLMRLRRAPAERFVQPLDPAVLLTGDAVQFPARYGGDGRFNPDGYLVCRTDGELLTAAAVGSTTLTAASLTGVTAPAGLPAPALITALLRESCLLCTQLLANLSGDAEPTLRTALALALEGEAQSVYTLTGRPPSPVGVNWWTPDQWLPIFASWTVSYLPLQPTSAGGAPVAYGATIVNANFRLDQDAGGTLTYAPSGKPGTITIDPATAGFTQQYIGAGNLTPTPAATLTRLLTSYLETHKDATLSAVLAELTSGAGFLVAPLSGFVDALTMRQRGVQLQVQVPSTSEYAPLTEAINPIAGDAPREGGPDFDSDFNPLRAGYLKLSLTLVDAFGQKRDVEIAQLECAESMTTEVAGATVPSVAYLSPAIAQPSRLAFHWLAADGSDTEELTGVPAVSPVCGWLLPNHVDGSLALYDALGRPLGTLFPEHGGGDSAIGWQSAPGDARTIDEDLATVMQYQNPQLAAVALALGGPQATAENFAAMWAVIDTVGQTIEPGPLPTDSDLAVLVGRPIALVQAAVRLELQGAPMLDLGWDVVGTDSDAGLTGIQFPVVLGDLAKLRDGLIGYYKETAPGSGYDLSTFYSQGADRQATSGVVLPAQDTLRVTPAPPLGASEPPDLGPYTQKVLMLIDPRARVHATTGILPTGVLELPPDQSQGTISALDLSLFSAPVLRGAGALAIPAPSESGYAVSYVDQDHGDGGALEWVVTQVAAPTATAVWAYTPQEVREGWLRLNPLQLGFDLADAQGKPVVRSGQPNTLTLTLTNRSRRTLTFRHGPPVAEGAPPSGSVFYVHLGTLVAQEDVAQIALSAPGWTFRYFASPQYGAYWAAAPAADLSLPASGSLAIAVGDLIAAPAGAQAQVAFDYYAIDGVDDGVYADVLAIETKTT